MDSSSSSPAPPTTLRRNPPRTARKKHATAASSAAVDPISPYPINESLHRDPPDEPLLRPAPKPQNSAASAASAGASSNNLRVFLRIRPLDVSPSNGGPRHKPSKADARAPARALPSNSDRRKNGICLVANDSSSVTLSAPTSLAHSRRGRSEVFDGFSYVFPPDSLQQEVYDRIVNPVVMDFVGGKSGLLVAMGPTGSGKTYTMFGSAREAGMIRLTLEKLFDQPSRSEGLRLSRSFYFSMFEIYTERGKGERILDLSSNGVDLTLQQFSIIGLQEVMVSSLEEAEGLLARGMLKRCTAATSANYQSSRSQCIINIRSAEELSDYHHGAVLTIADLAGAEREKKTGNQGSRLLESNFINNTSMVFGLCLKSLLEHQKNPKKPLEKHFMNSLLTKYLRDYMEGKKQMTLILTVKPGEDDYVETSLLLKQASPYMKIKYNNLQENTSLPSLKRNIRSLNRTEQKKRRKVEEVKEEANSGKVEGIEVLQSPDISSQTFKVGDTWSEVNNKLQIELQKMSRQEEIMRNFAKAFWTVLKKYKQKLEESENNVQSLTEAFNASKSEVVELTNELEELRSNCTCCKVPSIEMITTSEANAINYLSSTEMTVQNNTVISSNQFATSSTQKVEESRIDDLGLLMNENQSLQNVINQESIYLQGQPPSETELLGEPKFAEVQLQCSDECQLDVVRNDCVASPVLIKQDFGDLEMLEEIDVLEAKSLVNEDIQSSCNEKQLQEHVEHAQQNETCYPRKVLKEKNDLASKPINSVRKRRLLPASAMLLKEYTGLDMEAAKTKEIGVKQNDEAQGRSQGSMSLVSLLKTNLR